MVSGVVSKGRLEAFSDGVIAILITVMVLELRPPTGVTLASLRPLLPTLEAYALSFLYIGIYWNNHHHLLKATRRVTGAVMWANHGLLFVLSLVPFATAWVGRSKFASVPMAVYGGVLFLAGLAYYALTHAILRTDGRDGLLGRAIGNRRKERVSMLGYLVAVVVSPWLPWLSGIAYAAIAGLWLIPDRRIERALNSEPPIA